MPTRSTAWPASRKPSSKSSPTSCSATWVRPAPAPRPAIEVAQSQQGVSTCPQDRKSTRLNSSHSQISYAVFCLKKKKKQKNNHDIHNYIHTERNTSHTHTSHTSHTCSPT